MEFFDKTGFGGSSEAKKIEMSINDAIQHLFDRTENLSQLLTAQKQLIYELYRALISVSDGDPASIIKVIQQNQGHVGKNGIAMLESLMDALHNEFIAGDEADVGTIPHLTLVPSGDRSGPTTKTDPDRDQKD